MMKKLITPILLGLILVSCQPKDLETLLNNMPEVAVSKIADGLSKQEMREQLKVTIDTVFSENFDLRFTQPINHSDPSSETFEQRVIVSHVGFDRPVVVILEGYEIWKNSGMQHEITKILNANQVIIEHRFFRDSKPDSLHWSYLTTEQAAADQHRIIQELRKIYKGKFLSTGISKGGQTAMYLERFYPEDIDVAVPYVAPLNFSNEEPKVYEFLNSVGTIEQRQKIYDFQIGLFKNKDAIMPKVKQLAEEKGYEFKMGIDRAYDLSILEVPFAIWQWGTNTDHLPGQDGTIENLYEYWLKVDPITFFEESSIEKGRPFFWQAMTEIGMYGYEVEPYKDFLDDTTNIIFDFTMPEGVEWTFNPKPMEEVYKFLESDGINMIFIYGENDAWSSTAYIPSGNTNSKTYFFEGGDHATRIRHFPEETQNEIYQQIADWMGVELITNK